MLLCIRPNRGKDDSLWRDSGLSVKFAVSSTEYRCRNSLLLLCKYKSIISFMSLNQIVKENINRQQTILTGSQVEFCNVKLFNYICPPSSVP